MRLLTTAVHALLAISFVDAAAPSPTADLFQDATSQVVIAQGTAEGSLYSAQITVAVHAAVSQASPPSDQAQGTFLLSLWKQLTP